MILISNLVELMNLDSAENITSEEVLKALHGLKTKGVIDFKISPDGIVKIEMIAPELMYGKPTYH